MAGLETTSLNVTPSVIDQSSSRHLPDGVIEGDLVDTGLYRFPSRKEKLNLLSGLSPKPDFLFLEHEGVILLVLNQTSRD
jgi:hypothetical protein